jgi:alkylation response protein AidB-like acyl-CoA dehydrogenase
MAGLGARQAARDGLQVFGGIGYTWEHDLHLRLRRAYGDDALCGTHEWHLDRLADLLLADGD